MNTIKEVYIFKETVKTHQLNDKHAVPPDRIFEAILQGEDHMT